MMRIELNKRESVPHLKRKPFSLILSLLFVAGILSLPLNSLATTDVTKEHPINFNQTISPILSKHCLECHGPDANQRKAGLRLDLYDTAISPRKSKPAAILPGNSTESLLIQRITSKNPDERMPPPGNGTKLSEVEIETLKTWIDEGASYQRHWAFEPVADQQLPRVRDNAWPSQSMDHFILAKLEQVELTPARRASRRTLIRRAYLDLIGLPPTPKEVRAFLGDTSPQSWQRVVEKLLSLPEYGERWGRHWLDVARYADSNGSDENHAYPHAHHYRNYVIGALNRDLPYDEFLCEQIAGDLLNHKEGSDSRSAALTATGFLSIGTKILAEQDPVKKRADSIDEQIDTFSKAILGLTISCARCHDHKFDPIPSKDYYSLAGILHSTNVNDQPIETSEFLAEKKVFENVSETLKDHLKAAEKKLEGVLDSENRIQLQAEKFDRGNVIVDNERYGKEIGIISDPGSQKNFVEYDLTYKSPGLLQLELRYAAASSRPGRILMNGKVIRKDAIANTTGGWLPEHQQWHSEGLFKITAKKFTLRIESEPMMSHIDQIRLTPLKGDSNALEILNAEIGKLNKQLAEKQKAAPKPRMVMAVKDGKIQDIKLHVRGSHRDLGNIIPRGAPIGFGFEGIPDIPKDQSGRLQLAKWLARPDHPLTARVMVNRVWRWHFGRGIVATPNNFGTKGQRPTHPKLLDHLALKFIRSGWSLKSLHLEILNSSTYQMASNVENPAAMERDPSNVLLWKREMRRMEAEVFRDSLLHLSGRLRWALDGGPMGVKSQDPSPKDLANNQGFYEKNDRRSVYLPVVRSNVYDLLTLLDFPNAATPVGSRVTTTVPTQALLMMNGDYLMNESRNIAKKWLNTTDKGLKPSLNLLYEALLTRSPTPDELEWAKDFLEDFSPEDSDPNKTESWNALCHTLVMSNDFIHVR